MLSYLKKHWRGELSLAIAFWVNFIGVRLVLFIAQANLLSPPDRDFSSWSIALWLVILFGHGVLFIWQVVGVFRSAEHYLKETGSQATVWGAQLSTVFGLFLTISYAMQAWQATFPKSPEDNFFIKMEREHASKYQLKAAANGEVLFLDGTIELGITRNLRSTLEMNNKIRTIIFNSSGGNIFEARGIAKLVRENGLDSHVTELCSSACTMAFSGGIKRTMDKNARFGFHQYRVDANYTVLAADPEGEQKRDISLFKEYGVGEEFLQIVFSTPSEQMWFPDMAELLKANFVHEITEKQ